VSIPASPAPAAAAQPAAVLGRVVGQSRARELLEASVRAPVHAYLFVGPAGTGKRDAAIAFAAALVCPDGGCGACPACRDALSGRHPDVVVVERTGAAITVDEARAVTALAQRTPAVATRQVLVLVDFHLVERAGPALLKTIEEPPGSTVFIVLAETIPPALVTIASRCVKVEFAPLEASAVVEVLVAEGIDSALAAAAAAASSGRLDRARLLAADPGFSDRQARWRSVPERLDGTGATVALLAAELLGGGEELVAVLKTRQAAEITTLTAEAERAGLRQIPDRHGLDARHTREQRRVRTDELRAGLAALAGAYRSRLGATGLHPHRFGALAKALAAIDEANEALDRNPNETLLVQALLLRIDGIS